MMKLSELRHPAWNPRTIDAQGEHALKTSLKEFGDLSGIVVNKDNTIIAGNQRVRMLREMYGDLRIERDVIKLPDGKEIKIRRVDWEEKRAQMASIAANSELVAGKFTPKVKELAQELAAFDPATTEALRLCEIEVETVATADLVEENEGPPEMELLPYEHYDYVIVLARNTRDWYALCERLGLKQVNASPVPGKRRIGLGRAVEASRLLKLIGDEGNDTVPDRRSEPQADGENGARVQAAAERGHHSGRERGGGVQEGDVE